MTARSAIACVLLLGLLAGCQKTVVTFPTQSVPEAATQAGAYAAYDTNGDGTCDYFLFANSQGRVDRIGYGRTGSGSPTEIINLDELPSSQCRHLVLILDGVGYDVLKKFYDQGHLRLMSPPSRVIAPYPSLTDLCVEDALGYIPCRGFEAAYFDHQANRVAGGAMNYVQGGNEPYNRLLDHRAGLIWDGISYLWPWPVFQREINQSYQQFRDSQTREFLCYYVSSAAVGTRQGEEGQLRCLQRVDQMINQAIFETRGLTKVTILADHGHSYTPATLLPFEQELKSKGWNLTGSLHKDNDVVQVQFGLETYASFATLSRQKLAADLVTIKGVELASYAEGDKVIVLDAGGGKATIARKENRYSYQIAQGDPVRVSEAIKGLTPDAEGFYDADELFQATATGDYPDPLARLWRAHFGIAEHAPDVIVSLADNYCAGSSGFAGTVNIASTHGSLNRSNSTTFIMTSAGDLPPLMRSMDIPANLRKTTGRPFPEKTGAK